MNKILMIFGSILMMSKLGNSGSIKCSAWREILPCTCQVVAPQTRTTTIECENMHSFQQVVDLLRGHLSTQEKISLKVERSHLRDLHQRQLREINATIESIYFNYDYLGYLDENTFAGMSKITSFSLADSPVTDIPENLWKHMPHIATANLGRMRLTEVLSDSFKGMDQVISLLLPGNQIERIDRDSFPLKVQRLHLGRNKLSHLNGTVIGLKNLEWLFLNTNNFEDLEGQLPYEASQLTLLHASDNRLSRIPQQISDYPSLANLFLNNNEITTLDESLAGCRSLERVDLVNNKIHTLTATDFVGCERLDHLQLMNNHISSLNNSLLPLKGLEFLNVSQNLLTEFSFSEILGLDRLGRLDLSFNQISSLIGPASNLVDVNIKISELYLHHNSLEYLNSALSGLSDLLRLDLSYNRLRRISPDDLINLDQLRLLDVSYNQLKTLEEMSKTYLPRLNELIANHNEMTILEHDFFGLPVLCYAHLADNKIVAISRDLVMKTRCKIEHGVHDGTWDTLKLFLSGNPILCDAAVPEITSEMETKHAKVIGVSHCPPLQDQPITAKPNAYLGYVPDHLVPTAVSPLYYEPPLVRPENQIEPKIYQTLRDDPVNQRNDQYQVDNLNDRQPLNDEPIAVTLHKSINQTQPANISTAIFDPITQGQVITKLASEIEELKTRIEEISAQNERLFNNTNLTVKVP